MQPSRGPPLPHRQVLPARLPAYPAMPRPERLLPPPRHCYAVQALGLHPSLNFRAAFHTRTPTPLNLPQTQALGYIPPSQPELQDMFCR